MPLHRSRLRAKEPAGSATIDELARRSSRRAIFRTMIDPERIRSIRARPGCYIFKDAGGAALYVGKAASLRSRVRSYFGPNQSIKMRAMLDRATEVETVVTDSEVEALILENNLIKEKRPRYNVVFRDDKQFPYLCITINEPFPRVLKVRRAQKDGNLYFGPFANAGALGETVSILKKLFPYRSCDLTIPDEAENPEPVVARPCLEYFIKRCNAPCVRYTTREEYRGVIDQVILFLQGKHEEVIKQVRSQMRQASEELHYELAARLRDQLASVERIAERQKITSARTADQDIIGVAQDATEASIQLFHVRQGKVVAQDNYILEVGESEPSETLSAFVKQYYERAAHIPRELVLEHAIEDAEVVAEWLRRLRGGAVSISVPRIGEKRRLVRMVAENARQTLEQHKQRWMSDMRKTAGALQELQAVLGLDALPNRIECFDISNIQGASAVGSMVVFERGKPKNAEYRRFKIKSVEGSNDFAMMEEVLERRFKRVADDSTDESFMQLPDLVIIDGGKGQLSAVLEATESLGRGNLAVASLAKRLEEVFLPGSKEPVLLPRNSQALYLLQRIRDEAHRFAVSYHRNLRQRRSIVSQIDSVPGVGAKRRKALIKAFGSVRGVKQASPEEIAAVPGMSAKLAKTVKEHLGGLV